MHSYNIPLKKNLKQLLPFFLSFFNLVLINWTEWSMIPACPRVMGYVLFYCFHRGKTKRTIFKNWCFMFMYVCFALCLCRDWFYGLSWERVYIYIHTYMRRRFLKHTFAYK